MEEGGGLSVDFSALGVGQVDRRRFDAGIIGCAALIAWRWSSRGGEIGLSDLTEVDEEGGDVCVLKGGKGETIRIRI